MNAPTLIVGLGGKGSDVALRVSQMVSEEERRRIGFAVFDTDVNELRKIKEKNSFVHTIQTSTKLSVGEYLDIDTHARDTWFPVNAILNSKTLTEGAGQVRAVSRMAFETAIRAGKMEELHQAIESLYKLEGDEYQQALRVIIVSSLAGGTGSGLILPVALYIKNYLATRFRQSANIIRGFFLLPEVFYGVIPGQAERNNLKSNAYATLRELDAFMMKADSTLPEKYKKTVKMEFPCVGSGEYEEYDVRPFDFCFLFDAQNADGKKLNSFNQYLDHAASCIYAQSIGPMNKRSNSSEDNTIRKLCEEAGRNRYAGAGTSMLVYPVEEVKKYLALSWAKESVSDQWMVFDDMFKKRSIENAKAKKQGARIQELKEDKCYVDSVEQMAKNKDPFAMAIVEACGSYDESGFTRIADKWDEYIMELKKKIEFENASGQADLDSTCEQVTGMLHSIGPGSKDEDWELYVDVYKELSKYRGMVQKHVGDVSRTIAYTIFRADEEALGKDGQKYQLETHMRNSRGDFIHPNAVRYFLCKVMDSLDGELQLMKINVANEEKFFADFEKDNFDDKDTDVMETVYDLAKTHRVSLSDKILRRLSSDQEDLLTAYSQYLTHVNEYRVNAVYVAVLEEGISYVKGLIESFQNFYRSFDSKIASLNRQIRTIEGQFAYLKGTAKRYVCASPVCLQKMLENMPYTGGTIEIDSRLAETIYSRVRSFSMMDSRPENTNFFSNIFDVDILNYFKNALMDMYGSDIDMDAITAIEKEAEYEHGIYDDEERELYVVRTFNETKVLAAPFIEKPLGEEKSPINSCAFNKNLKVDDDSPRAQLVDRELMNFGGEADEDVPKNMILFYKSFYGLRANDLSKFAPPQKAVTCNRTGGEYFKAYYELVSKIHPLPDKSRVITPHIGRWWHNVAMMPDLDENNQLRQENEIYAALFWGLVSGYVDMYETGYDQRTYRLNVEDVGVDEDSSTLVVSNGTPCDTLYEVWDALSIYPELVTNILKRKAEEIEAEVNGNKSLGNSSLVHSLESFRLREYELGEDNGVRSVFDIPLLIKKSMTPDIYEEEKVIRILKVEIEQMEQYAARFCSAREYPEEAGKLIRGQFDRFLKDIEIESGSWKDIYHDYLFTRTCSNVAKALEDLGLRDEAAAVRARAKELSK